MAKKKLDWSKLPESLHYLIEPVMKYGELRFDDPIYDFLQNQMTDQEKAELIQLGTEMSRDWDQINRWLDEFNMSKHQEAALVYFTIHLLALGGDLGLLE